VCRPFRAGIGWDGVAFPGAEAPGYDMAPLRGAKKSGSTFRGNNAENLRGAKKSGKPSASIRQIRVPLSEDAQTIGMYFQQALLDVGGNDAAYADVILFVFLFDDTCDAVEFRTEAEIRWTDLE
jgi:hypothetical protein